MKNYVYGKSQKCVKIVEDGPETKRFDAKILKRR